MSDHSVDNSGATLIFVGGADNGGELLHEVVDGLGVEQLLLALHDPGLALLAGHRVVLRGLADSSAHPVGLQKSRDIHAFIEKISQYIIYSFSNIFLCEMFLSAKKYIDQVNICTSGE